MPVPRHNLPVPFLGGIDGNMCPGKIVRIHGSVPHLANRFTVNLKCGPYEQHDIAIHLSVRFPENIVVINSLIDSQWGPEEAFGHMPFERGLEFELLILCDPDHFKIAVNGVHIREYVHRMPYERVTHLHIDQDVQLTLIQWEAGSTSVGAPVTPGYPEYVASRRCPLRPPPYSGHPPGYPPPPPGCPPPPPGYSPPPPGNPPVPFLGGIDGNMRPGKMVRIHGSVPHSANRFTVNLKCGPYEQQDIALHLSVRFTENVVVRNSLIDSQWGPEEAFGHMPFARGLGFELLILCDPDHFKIAVNGVHFTEYVHRMPYEEVTHLHIDQDVQLTLIQWEAGSTSAGAL